MRSNAQQTPRNNLNIDRDRTRRSTMRWKPAFNAFAAHTPESGTIEIKVCGSA
jgi:hypothetical protein